MPERTWRPLIIAGLPRSGTTLLSTFLASQARCTFITDYLPSFSEAREHLRVRWNTPLTQTQRRIALAIVRDQLLRFRHPVLVGVDSFRTLTELHLAVLDELAQPDDLVVGHKLLLSAEDIRATLAETDLNIVVMYRNPRDAALSYYLRTGGGVEAYLRDWREAIALMHRSHDSRLFPIRYENLIGSPESTLSPLFGALALPLDVRRTALSFDRGPAGRVPWKGNASFAPPERTFNPSVAGRWRENQDSPIVRYATWACRHELSLMGYPRGPLIPRAERLRWEIHRLAHRTAARVDVAWRDARAAALERLGTPLKP